MSAYDFFLKITKPETAEKIEKLKLHSKGTFEREFWEDLELSKNTFPLLRKISLKNVKFNLFNLKFFKNTAVESFNFRNTCINKLEYIEFLLRSNKRVLISDEKHVDTVGLAINHAVETKDYAFLTLAIQTGSWSSKNAEGLAKTLLAVATIQEHFELMQKWAENVVLPANAPKVIQDAISSIKRPMITFKAIEEETVREVMLTYPFVMSNPVLLTIYNSHFSEKNQNCIQMAMSIDCFENMMAYELRNKLAEGIGLGTLIEMAQIADMYDWKSLKESLLQYPISCEWDDQEYEDDYEKLEAILDLLPSIPDFMKLPIFNQVFASLDINNIKFSETLCSMDFHVSLIPIIKKLPSTYDVHLISDLDDLDLSSQELLLASGPYQNVKRVSVNCNSVLPSDMIREKIVQLGSAFPSCSSLEITLDFRSYPAGLEDLLKDINMAFTLKIDIADLNLSAAQVLRENAPYDKVKKLIISNSNSDLPPEFIVSKIKQFATLFPSCSTVDISQWDCMGHDTSLNSAFNDFKVSRLWISILHKGKLMEGFHKRG